MIEVRMTGVAVASDTESGARRSRTTYSTYRAVKQFTALDALRAVSVLAVVWHHTSGTPGPFISGNGALGVEFFFAISGFLITTLLLREHDGSGRISLGRFYIRRSLRIFPLYYAVLAVYVLLTLVLRADTPEGQTFLQHLPAFLTYSSNWFVDLEHGASVTFYFAWSLATEEQFYLLWPPLLVLVIWLTRGGQRAIVGAGIALVALIVLDQLVTAYGDPEHLLVRILSSLSLPILLGALLAVTLHHPKGYAALSSVLGRRWSAPVVFAILIASVAVDLPVQIPQTIMVIAVATVTISEHTLLHPALTWRPLAFIGVISYGVYLMHMLVANAVRAVLPGPDLSPLIFAVTVPAVVLVAYLSFRFFETPILRFKRRFSTVAHVDAVGRAKKLID